MADEVRVLLVQSILHEAMNGPSFDDVVRHNLYRSVALVEKSIRRVGKPNIVVLPEFFLTGLASTRSHDECIEMGRLIPGPETDVLGEVASEHGIYIAGATWERDDRWPGRWFNTAFIVGPRGNVELKYRKINEGNYQLGLTDTTPGDVYSRYVELYQEDALWPVLETEYGNLSCIICFDLNFAETTQMMALRGAEIILHPTGEPYGQHREVWELARRTRAFENAAYLVSANHGGYVGTVRTDDGAVEDSGLMSGRVRRGVTARSRSHGGSEVVDFRGRVVARIEGQGEAVIEATLDLAALRRARSESGPVPRLETDPPPLRRLWAIGYQQATGFPLDELLDDPLREQPDGPRHLASVLDRLAGTPLRRITAEGLSPVAMAYQAAIPFLPVDSDGPAVRRAVDASLEETARHLELEIRRTGADVVVLPDGWPVSFLAGGPAAPGAGLEIGGAHGRAIGELARSLGIHLVGAGAELSADGRAYRTAYIFDDQGELIHTHRDLSAGSPGYGPPASPSIPGDDDEPADHLAVVETRFGTWATVVGREVASVQTMRLLVYRGAEVVFNPTADYDEAFSEPLRHLRRVRANENCIYLVAAGQGPLRGGPAPQASRSGSLIVDHGGDEMSADRPGVQAAIAARLDMGQLRTARGRSSMNFVSQLRPQLYARQLAGTATGIRPAEADEMHRVSLV